MIDNFKLKKNMKIKNIRHTGIVTDDLNKSVKFYRDYLGFKIKKKMLEYGETTDKISNLKNARVDTVKMSAPNNNGMLELLYYRSHHKINKRKKYNISEIGISHFSVTVSDLNKLYINFKKRKIYFICPPKLSSDKKVLITFCRAPEGTLIELVQELKR